jgi:hypothetical protein
VPITRRRRLVLLRAEGLHQTPASRSSRSRSNDQLQLPPDSTDAVPSISAVVRDPVV